LSGCKKIQQQLASPGVVEELLKDNEKSIILRSCFAPMYPAIDIVMNKELKYIYDDVCFNPLHYVLKPQREGGGYNIWGDDIVSTLHRCDM
jgi:glutathione synthase